MIKSVKITNHLGEMVNVNLKSPEQSGFFIKNITGIGAGKSNINISESLYQDGGFFNSSRRNTRNIVMDLGFYADHSIYSIEMIRNKTYQFFPPDKKITLEITTDTKVATTEGYVESNEPNIFSKEESTQVSLICPDPNFYGPTIKSVTSEVSPMFQFPFENASLTEPLLVFGNITTYASPTIVYTGEVETGIILYVNFIGPVTNLKINDTNTGKFMLLDSTKVQAVMASNFVNGDLLTITTIKGSKSALLRRGGIYYNLMNAVTTTSTWFSIDRGFHVFTLTADANVGNASLSTEYKVVYGGV